MIKVDLLQTLLFAAVLLQEFCGDLLILTLSLPDSTGGEFSHLRARMFRCPIWSGAIQATTGAWGIRSQDGQPSSYVVSLSPPPVRQSR
jgi:hypothetical protein